MNATPLPVRMKATTARQALGFVLDAGTDVRVRVRWTATRTSAIWICDAHGLSDLPRCAHAVAVAHELTRTTTRTTTEENT